jgi:hypothetical protein
MVIDPYLVHAYWDVNPAHYRSAVHAVLRVYDTTCETSSYFDVPVSLPARNWYVQLWTPERAYFAELGLVAEGGFTALARSNTIQTPRAWPVAAPPAVTPAAEMGETAPLPLVTAQKDTPLSQPDIVLPAPESDIVLPPPQPDTVLPPPQLLPSRDREGAGVAAEAPAPSPPPIPEPVNAAELLRARLEAIYAALDRPPGPRKAAPAPATAPPVHPNDPVDLTQLAEEHFTSGVSSKPPKPPA